MLQRSHSPQLSTDTDDIVIVLPNGVRQIVDIEGLETFSNLKCHIELLYGLPYELQRIFLPRDNNFVADWVPLVAIREGGDTEVFIKTEQSWTTFVSTCLRAANAKVLALLDTVEDRNVYENRLFVASCIAIASNNEILLNRLFQCNPKLDKRTASGRNLLHFAVLSDCLEIINLILKNCGVQLVTAQDSYEETPVDLAKKVGATVSIELFQGYLTQQVMETEAEQCENQLFEQKKKVTRQRISNSLSIPANRRLSVQTSPSQMSRSTPTSPRCERVKREGLLDREKIANSLSKPNENKLSSRRGKMSVGQLELPNFRRSSVDTGSKLSPRSPLNINVSLRRKSMTTQSAPVSPNTAKAPHFASTPSPKLSPNPPRGSSKSSVGTTNGSGLQQVVFLPPWRRDGSHRNSDGKIGDETMKVESATAWQRRKSSLQVKRNDVRSHSVASLSPEELRDLETRARTTKPWNAWRRISLANKNEKNELFRELKNDPSERKKSFENWLVEKEVTRDIFTARMLEEERLKKLEKEKLEEERRLRCKSHDKWLAEKEVELEIFKEEEKKQENDRISEEEKMQQRRVEAERKYEKWMREKYEEELRKEAELEKEMLEKWRLKQEAQLRRKSVAVMNGKQPLTKATSLPIV
eukprot:Seg2754.4 transcript_id=Seg2754.4/GoldUCD/mRNA.D3Y31 product="hypothetical protein" protein_id=Seg2754.4/GoldUCD/D3Y31